jgi:hypothetical protein
MQIDLLPILIFLISLVTTVAITFYLKDYLQSKNEYRKLRKKLEKVAGKNSTIIYATTIGGFGASHLYKIYDIDDNGITLHNDMQTIFVPAKKLLQSEMIVPCEEYEKVKMLKMKKDMEDMMDNFIPAMFDKLFPAILNAMKNNFMEELIEEEGEVNAVIGFKIQKILSEEGYEIKKTRQIAKKSE